MAVRLARPIISTLDAAIAAGRLLGARLPCIGLALLEDRPVAVSARVARPVGNTVTGPGPPRRLTFTIFRLIEGRLISSRLSAVA